VFRAAVEGAREWFDWCLEGLAGLRGSALSSAVEERFHLLLCLERPLDRSVRLAEMARFLALPEKDVRAQWDLFLRAQRPALRPPDPARVGPGRTDTALHGGLERAYASLIGALLLDNSLVPLHAPLLADCPEGELALLFRTLLELYESDSSGAPIDASALMTALGDLPERARVAEIQARAETAESAEALARDNARVIEQARRNAELEAEILKVSLGQAKSAQEEAELLQHLHQELRIGRVPSPKAASVHSP